MQTRRLYEAPADHAGRCVLVQQHHLSKISATITWHFSRFASWIARILAVLFSIFRRWACSTVTAYPWSSNPIRNRFPTFEPNGFSTLSISQQVRRAGLDPQDQPFYSLSLTDKGFARKHHLSGRCPTAFIVKSEEGWNSIGKYVADNMAKNGNGGSPNIEKSPTLEIELPKDGAQKLEIGKLTKN